ncbi:hypothetical protein GGR56DRAFT_696049 [Xylariaceae sp. FL0804]|nr:hypothetical protein GGR56DRAFT_696049 [Xylariaceae sp. FL0804]
MISQRHTVIEDYNTTPSSGPAAQSDMQLRVTPLLAVSATLGHAQASSSATTTTPAQQLNRRATWSDIRDSALAVGSAARARVGSVVSGAAAAIIGHNHQPQPRHDRPRDRRDNDDWHPDTAWAQSIASAWLAYGSAVASSEEMAAWTTLEESAAWTTQDDGAWVAATTDSGDAATTYGDVTATSTSSATTTTKHTHHKHTAKTTTGAESLTSAYGAGGGGSSSVFANATGAAGRNGNSAFSRVSWGTTTAPAGGGVGGGDAASSAQQESIASDRSRYSAAVSSARDAASGSASSGRATTKVIATTTTGGAAAGAGGGAAHSSAAGGNKSSVDAASTSELDLGPASSVRATDTATAVAPTGEAAAQTSDVNSDSDSGAPGMKVGGKRAVLLPAGVAAAAGLLGTLLL